MTTKPEPWTRFPRLARLIREIDGAASKTGAQQRARVAQGCADALLSEDDATAGSDELTGDEWISATRTIDRRERQAARRSRVSNL